MRSLIKGGPGGQPGARQGISGAHTGEEILEYGYKYHVQFIHAPEEKILEAREILAGNGIYCEHTTAANYAAYLEFCRQNGETRDCLITMCGAGLKSDH